jgi:aminoglycoside phosphotransferase (APT) family kinase protein
VPEIRLFCDDPDVVGTPFVLMNCIDGVVPDYRSLPEFQPWRKPANRTAMARELVRVLGRIQQIDWRSDPVIRTLSPKPSAGTVPPVVGRVSWILEKLVHGDYKIGNFIWQRNSVVAVLDWEGAGIGDPLEDLGYACHPIMRARAPELMAMLVPFDELARIYEGEMGRALDLPHLHYYVIYALYFHLYTLVSGIVAAVNGADLRVALGYSKFHRVTRELVCHMEAFEAGRHVL